MKIFNFGFFTMLALAAIVSPSPHVLASAPSVNFVTHESEVRPDGLIDWNSFGGPAPSLLAVHNLPGNSATITEARFPNSMQTYLQSPVSPGLGGYIQGAFAPLERVLSTGFGPNGPMTLTFSSPIAQVGMQIQGGWYGTFISDLSAYDSNGILLGAFSRSGISKDSADDSAPFIGVTSYQVNISKLVIDVENYDNFGHYFFISSPIVSLVPIPEPPTILLAIAALAALALRRR